ncbi:hypothetical protein MARBORIA2_18890 [Methanobrevibacter arboriphilus]|jgi:uncharacterized repeat protein (TIGR01451 family)|uniref:Uncharacterized protein n=2 Tax=Methanobrevibacter arboriphilus TaxID=39441 RepID=A0ACA8R233_METAZ|nr:DUF11 domain-containing protein [Methanobrevibacter arboriphilus]BBL60983.1 hypothetical protein MarbSA_00230 [Methanobrevibacter arboriphilus]GLI12799.1 hypothetical protein MARBORIA2_18890 [Methanobrevibacter arboriphilus]
MNRKLFNESFISKTLIFSLIFFILIISIATVSAASEIYVSPDGKDSNIGTNSSPKLTIKNAVNVATSGDNIKLKNGTYNLSGDYNIVLSKNLTFIGENAIIDAQRKSNMFKIQPGANVTFINITFINGLDYQGGSISNKGFLTVKNCVFKNNTANTASGGGAIHSNGTFLVENSTFINNYAGYSGGAIYNDGSDNSIIKDSNFINNSAYQHGGAMDNVYGSNITIINSSFINNSVVVSGGGALYLHDFDGDDIFIIINSTFVNNTAKRDGGAIYNLGNNTIIEGSEFINNTAEQRGGAIYNQNTNTTINNSAFINNTLINSPNYYGGSIYNSGLNLKINGSKFISNSMFDNLIAIYTTQPSFNITNNDFSYNEIILGLGFDNSNIDFNKQWINNSYKNNEIIMVIEGNRNNFNNGLFIGDSSSSSVNSINNSAAIVITGKWNNLTNINISNFTVAGIAFHQNSSYNTFKNGNIENIRDNISNFGIGIQIFGSGNNVTGSNIINNDIGFFGYTDSSVSNAINYNRILNNTNGSYNWGNWLDLNYNWWGQNNISGQLNDFGNNTDLKYWYVLQLSSLDFETIVNASKSYPHGTHVIMGYNFTLNDNSVANNPNLLPLFNVTVELINQTGVSYVIYSQSGDIRNSSYSSNPIIVYNNETIYMIYANSDNENVTLRIDGIPSVNITINKTANVTTPNNGDNITYTITVKNNGLDNATGVFVSDILDPRLIFISSDGNYTNSTGIWNIGTLSAGQTVTLTINVTINGTGFIPNYASVNSTENNTNPNTTVSYNITVPPYSDLILTKTANVTSAKIGDYIEYMITVRNNGPNEANLVKVYDWLDHRLIFISSSTDNGSYDNNTGIWDIGNISSDETVNLTIIVQANALGVVPNVANVTANTSIVPHPNITFNVTIYPVVNITINKTVNITVVNDGSYVQYIITVINYGPDNATEVVVYDLLDERLRFISSSDDSNYNYITGIWNIGNLTSGETRSLIIDVMVNGLGNITNFANVTSKENNTNPKTNDSVDIFSNPTVNVTVNKTVSHDTANIGDGLVYNLVVTNNGPSNATNVYVFDKLDPRLIFVEADGDGVYDENTGIWYLENLNSGESAILTIIVIVNGTGNIVNKANVTTFENNTPPDTNVNVTTKVDPLVNITINKSVNVTKVKNGEYIKYIITVINNGPDNATNVLVLDKLNSKLIYISDNSKDKYNPNTGLWNIGDLADGEVKSLIINAKVNGIGNISNFASVNSTEKNVNPKPKTNISIISKATFDVSISITAHPSIVKIGKKVYYTVKVSNDDVNKATGAKAKINIPKNLELLGYKAFEGIYNPKTGIWDIGSLEPGKSVVLRIVAKTMERGYVDFPVFVKINQAETNLSNNNADVEILVLENNKTKNNTDNKTQSTDKKSNIGYTKMKNTGIPVAILFILAVFYLFVNRKIE